MRRLRCPMCGCVEYGVLWEKDHVMAVSKCDHQHEVHFSSRYEDFAKEVMT